MKLSPICMKPRCYDCVAAIVAIMSAILILFAPSTGASMEWDIDLPGQDYRNFPLSQPAPSLCRDECVRDPQCRAWTFVKPGVQDSAARCRLKHSIPPQIRSDCCISGIKMTATIPAARVPGLTQTFRAPMIRGYRLDWCLELGHECGKPAADEFCRMHGFNTSIAHSPARHIGAHSPTMAIISGQICNEPECDGFLIITCAGYETDYSPPPAPVPPGAYRPPMPPGYYVPPAPPVWPGYGPSAPKGPPGVYTPPLPPKGSKPPKKKGSSKKKGPPKMKGPPKILKLIPLQPKTHRAPPWPKTHRAPPAPKAHRAPPAPKTHRAPPAFKMLPPPKMLKLQPPGPKPHRAPTFDRTPPPPGK